MSISAASPAYPSSSPHTHIRVMVVDDSVVARSMIMRWLEEEPDLLGVAAVRNGREAIEQIELWRPDVVILDLAMPDIDGLTALPRLLEKKPGLVVLVASTHARRNAAISMRALSCGASDYIFKPESRYDLPGAQSFRRELIDKIRTLGGHRQRHALAGRAGHPVAAAPRGDGSAMPVAAPAVHQPGRTRPRMAVQVPPRVLVIGASTGGPNALNTVVSGIGAVIDKVPVLIAQHMPAGFTVYLAEHLARASGRPAHEAVEGERIYPGTIYLAPGGSHVRAENGVDGPIIALGDEPAANYCKPALDFLFSSAVKVWNSGVLALVLTGMGPDGVRGAEQIVAAGGSVIVQDEESSVVWGMPGAVVNAGLASSILPLSDIASQLMDAFGEGRP
jgi:two-component system chemotaxis response regulator CheB